MDNRNYFYKNVPHLEAKKLYSNKRNRYYILKNSSPEFIAASLEFDIWSTRSYNEKLLCKDYDNKYNVILILSTNNILLGYALMKCKPGASSKSRGKFPKIKFEGKLFDIKWVRCIELTTSDYSHLMNKYYHNKPLTNSKDGEHIDKESGYALCKIFEKKFNKLIQKLSSLPKPAPLPITMIPPIPNIVPDIPSNFILPPNHIGNMMKINNIKSIQNMTKIQRKLKGENVYSLDMAAEFNPALIIFPIDLSNMSYDTYISIYNYSHEYWLKMPQDFDFLSLTSLKT